jgi:hypothetical protein
MTKAIDLSAPTVIVTLLAGLEGALIALPIAATGKVLTRELWPITPTTPAPTTQPVNTTNQATSIPQ